MFSQVLNPTGNLFVTWIIALIPVAALLFMLAALRWSAWVATLVGSIITFLLALLIWRMPLGDGALAYLYGSATGVWNVDWIVFWGVMLFNTLVTTGAFDKLRRWLIAQGTQDVRVQTILFAWAFGALLEGLVGFGYPWAFVAPILIAIGIPDLDAIRVAAIANNAPVSYGALGAPIIALAAVTGYPLLALSASISKIVAILALLPPWILLYLVSGSVGMWEAWPLAVVGSLAYIAGQLPVGTLLGPYLPDVAGAIVCFACLLILLKFWQPRQMRAYGGAPLASPGMSAADHGLSTGDIVQAWMPIAVLIVIVVAWTGPWSKLPSISLLNVQVAAASSISEGATIAAAFKWTPFVGGSAILASWIIVALLLRVTRRQLSEIWNKTWSQTWGALLVGIFIFGLAYVYNYSGMAASLAKAFSSLGTGFIVVAPILGFIGVALSGSNTSTNAMFGKFQALVGQILGFPPLLLPTVNSVGAEIGKPIAPQTASVGVSTTRFVRNEGEVIRHNFLWCLVVLGYLIVISVACYLFFPGIAEL
ncbi:L-lactate permease [Pseudaminobacter sp. 19-2017]|uniref:L-lactate permease n=1 Tax=Pseudaminobacter soli (ex Zhang et al. 2022) TaxID=2831468 RepID=A0A942E9U8_9HYPH|nr:L-lactate permease [Pseudaminobacter soli]MBS3651117.1 L-lactate permease [Pseudaminobacter soli]